jgi:tRNA (cmo5U34)-methyltransferase
MAAHTASEFFGSIVESYDSLIRRAVPRYDEMTARLMDVMPPSPTRILELGCGTGNLTLKLLERFRSAQVTAVDAAPQMTEVTAARSGGSPRLKTITAHFEDLDFPPASFDLIASAMSLHHVADKAPLYAQLFQWLSPRGSLRIADQLLGATDAIQARHWDLWLAFCREPGHCSEADIKSLIEHAAAHDHYEPLHAHFQYLFQAGFAAPDCVWRYAMYSVITAERP